MPLRRPIIGVMGSGSVATREAEVAGRVLAALGVHLLTGGGGGQMEAVAKSFVECEGRAGLSIGVLPCQAEGEGVAPQGYPNPYVEIPIQTHLWRSGQDGGGVESRNSINVLTCAALIFLEGSEGTVSEAKLAQHFGKPAVLYREGQAEARGCLGPLDELFVGSTVRSAQGLKSWLDGVLGGSF